MIRVMAIRLFCWLSLLFIGCGGGGEGGGSTSNPLIVSTISGKVEDGPIQNARVFVDLDLNGQFDSGEPFDITDEIGNFEISHVFDNQTEYLLVAEGSNALGTLDLEDNADLGNLNFVMFSSVITGAFASQLDLPVAAKYSANINPVEFRKYLKRLNEELSDSLNQAGPKISDLMASTEDDATRLFRENIVNTVADATTEAAHRSNMVEVAKLIQVNNDARKTTETKKDLSLGSSERVVFSEESTKVLSEQLAFVGQTTPNKFGDLVVTSQLRKVGTTEGFQLFFTPYQSILSIPEYGSIRDLGMTAILGADVVVKNNSGSRIQNFANQTMLDTILKNLNTVGGSSNFQALNETDLSYLVFSESGWKVVTDTISVQNNQIKGLKEHLLIAPMILARKDFLGAPKTFEVPGFSQLKNPIVLAKGHWNNPQPRSKKLPAPLNFTNGFIFPNLEEDDSVNLDINIIVDNQVTVRIPNEFILDRLLILSNDIAGVSANGKRSLSLELSSGEALQPSNEIPYFIEDDQLKKTLIKGSGIELYPGVDHILETRIPFQILRLLPANLTSTTEAKSVENILIANAKTFLGKEEIFSTQGIGTTTLGWIQKMNDNSISAFHFTLDLDSKICTLIETNQDGLSTVIFERQYSWQFSSGKISKRVSTVYEAGSTKGTLSQQSIEFRRSDDQTLSTIFNDTRNEKQSSDDGYKSLTQSSFNGSAMIDADDKFAIEALLSSRYKQDWTQRNYFQDKIIGGVNSLDGILFLQNNNLNFEGSFKAFLASYGQLYGKVVLRDPSTFSKGFDGDFYNNNLLTDATLTATKKPTLKILTIPDGLSGQWSGSMVDSCADAGMIVLQISSSSQTWAGQSSDNTRSYGTRVVVSGSKLFLYDNASLFSTGQYDVEEGTIKGSWKHDECEGTYLLSK